MKKINEISCGELTGRLADGREFDFIDVRDRDDYTTGSIAGSRCVPLTEVSAYLTPLPFDQPIVFVCDLGKRSRQATSFAASVGFGDVCSLEGGIRGWKDQGNEVSE